MNLIHSSTWSDAGPLSMKTKSYSGLIDALAT